MTEKETAQVLKLLERHSIKTFGEPTEITACCARLNRDLGPESEHKSKIRLVWDRDAAPAL